GGSFYVTEIGNERIRISTREVASLEWSSAAEWRRTSSEDLTASPLRGTSWCRFPGEQGGHVIAI
ncbi:hypothetical protein, partial [Roseomonas sp. KE2513]|uniref:hypothetical protein n=1 Tax=Roseomonas sp. KE2513 TaxID=2479202 RepID=UPI001E3F8CDE